MAHVRLGERRALVKAYVIVLVCLRNVVVSTSKTNLAVLTKFT